jgi:uncharacterized membrane protein HdeD (DUF308 family)
MSENSSTQWMPTAGGILNIISGVFGIIGGIFLVFFAAFFRHFMQDYYWDYYGDYNYYPGMEHIPVGFWWFLAIITIAIGILALIGGLFAIQRKNWGLALTGSICAILQGFNILGIISTVFIAMSRKEFPQ